MVPGLVNEPSRLLPLTHLGSTLVVTIACSMIVTGHRMGLSILILCISANDVCSAAGKSVLSMDGLELGNG